MKRPFFMRSRVYTTRSYTASLKWLETLWLDNLGFGECRSQNAKCRITSSCAAYRPRKKENHLRKSQVVLFTGEAKAERKIIILHSDFYISTNPPFPHEMTYQPGSLTSLLK